MALSREEFVSIYGGIYEHSDWVAISCYDEAAGVSNPELLGQMFARCVDDAPWEKRLALIRAHPDLAGRAAIAGELSEESSVEQASAGMDSCSAEEFEQFQKLNERYKLKFSFPFVMAVRNKSREEILDAFVRRLDNDPDVEFALAIEEIHKIARLRFAAMEE